MAAASCAPREVARQAEDDRTISRMGLIYCGDNLEVLAEYIPRESVDLVYLDPPFNSQRIYNLIYQGQEAQEEAFKDCWSWEEAAPTFHRVIGSAGFTRPLVTLMKALHDVLIDVDSDQLAYITMMTPRLVALHRALKPSGSLYLHCDPTASHYLKAIMDVIFGHDRFQNEIIWQRTTPKALQTRRLPNNHDVVLCYRKSDAFTWNLDATFAPYDPSDLDEKTESKYSLRDPDGRRYQLTSLINPNPDRPNLTYTFLGVKRVWRWRKERMQAAFEQGLVVQTKPGAVPRFKRYLDEQRGKPLGDVWTDIPPVNAMAKEKVGYPTQKPVALLKRILQMSSNEGDLVLDPFCGCGTTVEAAEQLGRRWIGIDIARKAIEVIEERFARIGLEEPEVVWHPADKQSAEALADRNKHQFEKWVLRKIRAARLRKKDRGIDGEAFFKDGDGRAWHVVVSVKGGQHLPPTFARDLRGVIEREKAIGVLVSLVEPGKEMKLEAARAGYLSESDSEGPIPRLQLVTVDRLFSELPPIRCPGKNVTELPKPSVPPGKDEPHQLALKLEPEQLRPPRTPGVRDARPRPKGQPQKTQPAARAPRKTRSK